MPTTLYPRPLDAILADIAKKNGVTLVESQYTYSDPSPYADPNGLTNTQLTLTAIQPDSPYQGPATIYYKRLDLSDLQYLLPLPIKGYGWKTVADFWAVLNANFGLNFVAGDLNDADALTIAADGSGSVTLVAQPKSLGWVGQVTLSFIAGNYDIGQYLTNNNLSGLNYPNRDESKPYGEAYSYWRDMSQWASDLSTFTTSSTDLSLLATDLQAQSGHAWVTNAPGRYSLQNASVYYNGPVAGYTTPSDTQTTPNTAYANVLVVKLDPTASLGYSGYLFLHYVHDDGFGSDTATAS